MSLSEDIAIRVDNLSKEFKLYARPADMFIELIKGKPRYKSFWALKDISFNVHRGQVVGILGRNGAGKSTLLKIISGTLDRTSGEIMTRGRISSILELGTGFNPEYTGRENIYLGGLMVGMSSREVREKEDWIIEFSELRNFIDQPFKTYSSGMQARLTFSTAICVDPDILIVDEALSVGDARFTRKSFSKMEEFRKEGRTILLVSHNTNQVASFCDYALILERGQIYDQGEPSRLRGVYYDLLFGRHDDRVKENGEASDTFVESQLQVVETSIGDSEYIIDPVTIKNETGYCWRVDLLNLPIEGDSPEQPRWSNYVLCEDGQPVGAGHSSHEFIRNIGKGFFSHWGKILLFSTSDNSNPQSNGRVYSLKREDNIAEPIREGEASEHRAIRQAALVKLGLKRPFVDEENSRVTRYGNGKAEFLDFGILDGNGRKVNNLISGRNYTFFSQAVFYENAQVVSSGFGVSSVQGMELYGVNAFVQNKKIFNVKKGSVVETKAEITMWLTNGQYFMSISIGDPEIESDGKFDQRFDSFQFEVANRVGIHTTSIVNLDEKFSIDQIK
ncbi:MAG: ABC transporter ATP-binding protein [Anaerolineales bacterium]|nr:ABC transporter ATP-binding protein [Anaerolineales bacterium]